MRLVFRVERRAERVDDAFNQTLSQAQSQHREPQQQRDRIAENILHRGLGERGEDDPENRRDIEPPRDREQPSHPEEVDQRPADQDRHGET